MNASVTDIAWNHAGWYTPERFEVIREVASYHCLCPYCFQLNIDPATGRIYEAGENCALAWSRSFEYPWCLLNADLKWTDVVLDAGGGGSPFLYAVAQRCCRLMDVDLSEEALGVLTAHPLYGELGNIIPVKADIRDLPFGEGYFDKVFCISVLEHVWNYKHALAEVMRVLKPGGSLLLTLDVRMQGEPDGEFFIGPDDAADLLAPYGGVLPQREGVLTWLIKSVVLSTLCVKIVKGEV